MDTNESPILDKKLWTQEEVDELLQKTVGKMEDTIHKLEEEAAKLEKEAMVDSLTGIPNRKWHCRKLVEPAQPEAPVQPTKERRTSHNKSVCFIDVNDFKQFNDSFGHALGDWVLQMVAQRVVHSIKRKSDTVESTSNTAIEWTTTLEKQLLGIPRRWAGDEFVVELSGTTLKSATNVAERIRRRIAETAIEWETTREVLEKAEAILAKNNWKLNYVTSELRASKRIKVLLYITVSIGVASFQETFSEMTDEQSAALIEQADLAMYLSKEMYKQPGDKSVNRVCNTDDLKADHERKVREKEEQERKAREKEEHELKVRQYVEAIPQMVRTKTSEDNAEEVA